MPRIVHFEIYADDVGRASKFYTDLFGWEINKWDGPPQMDYRLVVTGREGPGIDGGITGRPHEGVTGVNYVDVESIDDYLVLSHVWNQRDRGDGAWFWRRGC